MGTAKTSLGEPTLATVGTAPETPMVEEKPKMYSTHFGRKTLEEIKHGIADGVLKMGHYGDDVIEALKDEKPTVPPPPLPQPDEQTPAQTPASGKAVPWGSNAK